MDTFHKNSLLMLGFKVKLLVLPYPNIYTSLIVLMLSLISLYVLMMLLSTLNIIEIFIGANSLSQPLILNLTFERLQIAVRSFMMTEITRYSELGQVSLIVFNPIQDGRASLPVFPLQVLQTYKLASKTFWILVSTFLPFCYTCVKFQGDTYCQSQIIELELRPPFKKKKNGFSGQILINLTLR